MKKILLSMSFACVVSGMLSALTVSDVSAHARYPWQSVIDVDFTVSDSKAEDLFKVALTATCDNGTKKLYARTFLTEPLCGYGMSRVSWNVGADYPGLNVNDLKVAVTVSPVNRANLDKADVYMVIDLSSGPNSSKYPVSYTFTPPVLVPTNDLVACAADPNRTTKLWLKRVKENKFPFNSNSDNQNKGWYTVKLSSYYMGIFELTQKQWNLVMDTWPGAWSNKLDRAARPVEQINYEDVIGHNNWPNDKAVSVDSFVGRMRARTGLVTLNLPTEAQWECACRAGSTQSQHAGVTTSRFEKNNGDIDDWSGDPNNGTALVGSYNANAWGFYDFFGNVLEMCLDAYTNIAGLRELYEGQELVVDPIGPTTHSTSRYHVNRGGYYDNSSGKASNYDRSYGNSTITGTRDRRIGFRIVVSPEWK